MKVCSVLPDRNDGGILCRLCSKAAFQMQTKTTKQASMKRDREKGLSFECLVTAQIIDKEM